ncbi:MAG: phosphoglycolate phosphatase [Rhodobacteraceae bacterium PARR1]|nr:MAG: phosphoglycolate phosphatase [Rhodobacteraceae bacterium PARR1]
MAAVIFDLDGTLVDSAADIHAAVNLLLTEEGHPGLTRAQVTAMVGAGVGVLLDRVIAATGLNPAGRDRLLTRFMLIYEQGSANLTQPYPGVSAALADLSRAGLTLGLCTNKPLRPTLAILTALGWQDHFASVICGDSLPTRKPDPAMLHACVAGVGGGPVLFVGDSEVDAETAHAAGVGFLLFTEGYRKSPVSALNPLASFNGYAGLPALVARCMA